MTAKARNDPATTDTRMNKEDAMTQETPTPLDEFTEWFVKNYPGPNTIISNPHWHAPKIYRAATRSLERRPQEAERHLDRLTGMKFSDRMHAALVSRVEAAEARAEAMAGLPAAVLAMCRKRGWSMHWTHRGAYLHLEASELIEAIRGKHGDPLKEAADVLLVLMSITEYAGIPWESVVDQARTKCSELMTRPHYQGEEYNAALSHPLGGKT